MRRWREIAVLAIALVIVLADQASKVWVRRSLVLGVPFDPLPALKPILSFTYVTNSGAVFGMFPQMSWLFALAAIAVIIFIMATYRSYVDQGTLLPISLGLQLGGTAGNLVDRLLRSGRVTDFIDLNFWPLQEWPVFNIADSSMVVGVVLLAIFVLFQAEEPTALHDTEASEPPAA